MRFKGVEDRTVGVGQRSLEVDAQSPELEEQSLELEEQSLEAVDRSDDLVVRRSERLECSSKRDTGVESCGHVPQLQGTPDRRRSPGPTFIQPI